MKSQFKGRKGLKIRRKLRKIKKHFEARLKHILRRFVGQPTNPDVIEEVTRITIYDVLNENLITGMKPTKQTI